MRLINKEEKCDFQKREHFNGCNMSFYRFFEALITLTDISFESPKDLKMTSSDLQ